MGYTRDGKPKKRLRRLERPRDVRMITCTCYHRLPLLGDNAIKQAFVNQLRDVRQQRECKLFAYVVMPEHVHLLLQPATDDEIPGLLKHLKGGFAHRVLQRWRELDAPILRQLTLRDGHHRFWQAGGGHDRNVYTGGALHAAVDYLHHNPVRRQLVERPTRWCWSSARWYAGQRDDVLPMDPLPT
jgi:putative transposase